VRAPSRPSHCWNYVARVSCYTQFQTAATASCHVVIAAVHSVFGWPGLSRYRVEVILHKDLDAIVGTVLIIAAAFLDQPH
jgi:ABC-type dipeptide/oligopeptide/nickel transport system permease component